MRTVEGDIRLERFGEAFTCKLMSIPRDMYFAERLEMKLSIRDGCLGVRLGQGHFGHSASIRLSGDSS